MAELFKTDQFKPLKKWFLTLNMTSIRTCAEDTGAITYTERQTLDALEVKGPQTHNARLLDMVRGTDSRDAFERLAKAVRDLGEAYEPKYTEMMAILDFGKGGGPASPNMDQPPAAAEFGAPEPAVSDFSLKFWKPKEPVTSEGEYDMSRTPCGMALIICNQHFKSMAERKGADKDRAALDKLWKDLHFKTDLLNDAHANDMRIKLRNLATDPCHKEYNCVVICIMSHGSENTVYGSDEEEEPISELVELFHNDKVHKSLRDKPKMFFIQACRGEKDDTGAQADSPTASPTDILVCHATAPGYKSWCNPGRGSWFIQCLVDVFRKQHKKEHVADMMTIVNREIYKQYTDGHLQAPCQEVSLRKKVFLR